MSPRILEWSSPYPSFVPCVPSVEMRAKIVTIKQRETHAEAPKSAELTTCRGQVFSKMTRKMSVRVSARRAQ